MCIFRQQDWLLKEMTDSIVVQNAKSFTGASTSATASHSLGRATGSQIGSWKAECQRSWETDVHKHPLEIGNTSGVTFLPSMSFNSDPTKEKLTVRIYASCSLVSIMSCKAGHVITLSTASGDLRNVITTIAQIPHNYKKPIEVTINDHDIDVVARNVIMLLIAFVVKEVDRAAECIIHIWYSALIRQSDFDILQQQIRPMIQNVCQKTEGKPGSSLLSKTWAFDNRSLKLVLQMSAWDALLTFIDNRNGLTAEKAVQVRKAVTLAEDEESKDFRDRHLSFQSDFHRVALTRFQEDGLLLPFGAPRDDFKHPNPSVMDSHAHQEIRRLTSFRTLFHATQSWPMPGNADPLHGWSPKAIQETSSGPAKADIYGKLFTYLRALLQTFVNRLACQQQFSFRMYHVDARVLRDYLEAGSFSRIEAVRKTHDICR